MVVSFVILKTMRRVKAWCNACLRYLFQAKLKSQRKETEETLKENVKNENQEMDFFEAVSLFSLALPFISYYSRLAQVWKPALG